MENKVANLSVLELNLDAHYHQGERIVFDMADCLYEGLILREKDFRAFVKNQDWSIYTGKNVAVQCSADAIVPTWAYMVLGAEIGKVANMVVFGELEALETALFQQVFESIDWEKYRNEKVIVKGCSRFPVPVSAYLEVSRRLHNIAKLIMYGEACSSVPIFKNKESAQ